LFWHADDLRTTIEERQMGGLCLVVVPGEVAVSLESPDKFGPMILTVPAASPIGQDFEKMRSLPSQALLQLIQESSNSAIPGELVFLFLIIIIQFTRIGRLAYGSYGSPDFTSQVYVSEVTHFSGSSLRF
jgi:hypothetical protein